MEIEFHGNIDINARELLVAKMSNYLEASALSGRKLSIYLDLNVNSQVSAKNFNVLILQEPRAVMPWQYQSRILSKFQLLIPFSPWRSKTLGSPDWVFYPYKFSSPNYSSEVTRDIWISMINASKFSSGMTSNYGLRREVSKSLIEKGLDFKLYGWGWNSSFQDELRRRAIALRDSLIAREKISWSETLSTLFYRFDAYQGGIAEKSEILRRSELHIIIENDSDYFSEKLFDALTYLAVPIYVGPTFEKYLPALEKCIIRCEGNADSISKRIECITPAEVELKRAAIRDLMLNKNLLHEIEYDYVWTKISQLIMSKITDS
jgi:hypothetical protein